MSVGARLAVWLLAATALSHQPDPAAVAALDRSAYAVIDVPSGRTLAEQRAEQIDTPVWPGSIAKIATLAGALEAGTLTADTRIACTRHVRLADGRSVDCSHPPLDHALSVVDALTYSCNVFTATIARGLTSSALASGFVRFGLTPPPANADRVAVALGLAGNKVTPRALLALLRRIIVSTGPDDGKALGVLREGLKASARVGTAEAFGQLGVDALAKTGTALMPNGRPLGLVVAAWPSDAPREAVVLALPGGSGAQAAEVAAVLALRRTRTQTAGPHAGAAGPSEPAPAPRVVRVGTPTASGYRVEAMPFEDYVASVVAGETSSATPEAVRDALAITARTYALVNRLRHADEGFDLCTLTHCQVVRPATPESRLAASRTRGEVLVRETRPAPVFYSASCGGQLEDASVLLPNVARGSLPWLTARPDPAGVTEPDWQTDIDARDLLRALHDARLRGDHLRQLTVERTASGIVSRVSLDGLVPSTISADDFRRIVGRHLGWKKLKSLRFTVARTANGYRFEGRGHGHGVGLCVFGASVLAGRGDSTAKILETYFPGLKIAQASAVPALSAVAPSSAITLTLPSEEEGARRELRGLIDRTVRELREAMDVPPPSAIAVIVHPTGDSYRRATGRPWWTSAATIASPAAIGSTARAGDAKLARVAGDAPVTIHLVPLAALRQNNRLAPTLRHELVHALAAPYLRTRPLWVQEGVAAHFAGEHRRDAAATAPEPVTGSLPRPADSGCPDDRTFRQSRDRAASEQAYKAAAACVARELAHGVSWRDIGSR